MSEEALLILKMVQEGKMTPEQGVAFLEALNKNATANEAAGADSSSGGPARAAGWDSVSQIQRKLAETQQRLAEMQAKLGAAQAGGSNGSASASVKLPFGMGEFNLSQILDDTVKGVNALKTEAVISAKKAARQAQKEGRRFRQEAERMGKNIHVEVHVRTDERPRNTTGFPEQSARTEESVDLPVSGILAIDNAYGDVKVTGTSADGKIHYTAEKTVWAPTQAACEAALRNVGVQQNSGAQGECELVVAFRPDADAPDDLSVNLLLEVPPQAVIQVKTTYGKVHCESLDGGGVRRVETHSGDVRLLHVHGVAGQSAAPYSIQTRSGSVALSQWRGGSLTIESISGSVEIDTIDSTHMRLQTHSGDAQMRAGKLAGDLRIETVSGDLCVDGTSATGGCYLKTQSGDLELTNLRGGSLTLETVSGDLISHDCACATGRVTIKSISGDLESERLIASDLSLNTTSGDAQIKFDPSFTGSITGATVSGDVSIALPAAYAARLTMTTHSGSLKCDLPLTGEEGDGQQYLSGQLGGGSAAAATVMLQSVSGDLQVKKA